MYSTNNRTCLHCARRYPITSTLSHRKTDLALITSRSPAVLKAWWSLSCKLFWIKAQIEDKAILLKKLVWFEIVQIRRLLLTSELPDVRISRKTVSCHTLFGLPLTPIPASTVLTHPPAPPIHSSSRPIYPQRGTTGALNYYTKSKSFKLPKCWNIRDYVYVFHRIISHKCVLIFSLLYILSFRYLASYKENWWMIYRERIMP